jgi:hypothetical protein
VYRPASLALFFGVVLAAVLAGGWLRTGYAPEWKPTQTPQGLRPWAAEADCYSQLARVQRILQGHGFVQNHFTVENWPEGLTPSTTAPFDYVILALWAPLALVTHYPLDWAGALVSPALALGLIAFWSFFRSRSWKTGGRAVLIVGLCLVPALIWATAFGRPRHQSLIVALLAVALTAEYERWENDAPRGWHIAAGILWGFVCWTSLYEPLFVVVLLVIFNLIARRRENPAFGISFGVVMLLALLIEGVHVYVPPPEVRPVLGNWLQFIAEMQGMTLRNFFAWITFYTGPPLSVWELGPLIIVVSLLWAAGCLWRGRNLADRFVVGLALLLMILAFNQQRWLPYACLAEVFVFARYFQMAPLHASRLVPMAVLLFSLGTADWTQTQGALSQAPNQPSPELAKLAHSIDEPGGILAPWWLSPGLLYFSGQPIVAGSSHCGITGIEASAQFYTSTSWDDAARILQQRQVRWVVAWDDPTYAFPLLRSSQQILGLPQSTDESPGNAESTIAQFLIEDRAVPRDILQLRAVSPHFKLYEVVDPGTTVAPSLVHSPVAVR